MNLLQIDIVNYQIGGEQKYDYIHYKYIEVGSEAL